MEFRATDRQLTIFEFRLVRSIDLRIVPASMTIYLLCSLDRSNIVSGLLDLYRARLSNSEDLFLARETRRSSTPTQETPSFRRST